MNNYNELFMKKIALFAILLTIASFGCSTKKEVEPSNITQTTEEKALPETNKRSISDATTQEEDNKALAELLNEIYVISESIPCTDSTQWKTIALGKKACGGPLFSVPYSTKINEADFLKKTDHYNQQCLLYNKKWKLVSDCAIESIPTRVKCVNNKPVLY